MRLFLLECVRHVSRYLSVYLVLAFVFLTGCMTGYHTTEGISDALARSIQNNLRPRFENAGMDILSVFVAVFFAGAVWLCGLVPAGILFIPVLLFCSACIQVFVLRIALLDADLAGGFLGILCMGLLFFWSAAGLFLCAGAMENALARLHEKRLRTALSGSKNPGARTQPFGIASAVYTLFSWLIFLLHREIF